MYLLFSKKNFLKLIENLEDENLVEEELDEGNRGIGTKLVYNTGFKCNDSDGNEQDLYTYLDNSGNPNDGLIKEFGNSTANIFKGAGEFLSASKGLVDDSCTELNLKIITNSGKKDTKKAHIQNSEIDSINKSNIIENFSNIKDLNEILINSKSLYDDKLVFLYIIGITSIMLYLVFKLLKKHN